jgi:hypothetical protein
VEVFDSGLTACRVIGIGRNGIGFSGTSFKSAPHPGVSTDLTWSGVQVPTSGLMFVDCFMGPHARFSKNEHTPN